jgi:hypothetical protein
MPQHSPEDAQEPKGEELLMSNSPFTPSPLGRYRDLLGNNPTRETITVSLNVNQAAAVLKAHDHGIKALNDEEIALLDQVMSKLKSEIWP